MKVTMLNHTPNALELLLRTKNTRLKFDSDPASWSPEMKQEHLEYMRDTIKSSWEFVDYVFEIEGVTRAFTHQLVRTRTGSYAQESQRTVDVSGNEVMNPFEEYSKNEVFYHASENARGAYVSLLAMGAKPGDARGILPTNTLTSIVAKFNLRTLHDMAKLRLCTRTQGEYQDVFRRMRELVIEVHPWVGENGFLEVHCVSTGTCAFPRYGKNECPVYLPEMDNSAVRVAAAKKFWEIRHEASPVAKEGRAM